MKLAVVLKTHLSHPGHDNVIAMAGKTGPPEPVSLLLIPHHDPATVTLGPMPSRPRQADYVKNQNS